jgi:hypothetical protein
MDAGSRDMETGDAGGETPSHRFAFWAPGWAGDDKAVRRLISLFESEGIGKPLDLEGFSPSLGSANFSSQLLTHGFRPWRHFGFERQPDQRLKPPSRTAI